MIKILALLHKFCNTVWEYDADTNEIYLHYDNLNQELCGRWISYDLIDVMYREKYVSAMDIEIWEQRMNPQALKDFIGKNQEEERFYIQLEGTKRENEWREVFFQRLGESRMLLAGRDVKEMQRNAAIAKAVSREYDYVTYIDAITQNYAMFYSEETGTVVPESMGQYNQVLEEFNHMYVVPEESEKLTELMRLEHVLKELEEKEEYILYATMREKNGLSYKKVRFSYLNEKKDKVLMTRTDISALMEEKRLRAIEQEKRLQYLQNMPVAFCSVKVLVDDSGNPYDFQFTYCNRAHEELEGVKEGELLGKNFYEFFKEADPEWLKYYYETAYKGINHVIQRYSPEIQKHLLIYTFGLERGNCECVLLDVSEQYFLTQELEHSMENLKRIMAMTTALVFQFYPTTEEVTQIEKRMGESKQKITMETLKQNLLSEKVLDDSYWNTLEQAFVRMKKGEHSISVIVRGRICAEKKWNWYRVTMFDFCDGYTHERQVFGFLQNIDQEKNREEELRKKAQRDSLTGVFNAGTGKEKIIKKLERKQEDDGTYQAMLMMDVDNFKMINDTKGHLTGDKILKEFAKVLCRTFRAEDIIYRLGGDEFGVFVDKLHQPNTSISIMMQRLQMNMDRMREIYPFLSYSVGIFVTYKKHSFEECYEKADQALYETKNRNKGHYTMEFEDKDE